MVSNLDYQNLLSITTPEMMEELILLVQSNFGSLQKNTGIFFKYLGLFRTRYLVFYYLPYTEATFKYY